MLHRVRDHVATHNWFAVAVDLAIVVIGVFFGLQANNWNQTRIEREQGSGYRARLIEDLRSNEADMQQRRVYYSDVRRHAGAALDVIERPSAQASEQFLVDAYQGTQTMPRTMKRFTYDELVATGGIDGLGDAKLRERVTNYYVNMQTIEVTFGSTPPYREHLRQVMPYGAQRRVRSHCREILTEDAVGMARNSLPRNCRLGLDSGTVAIAAAQVREAPGITGDLTRYLIDLDLKLDLFDAFERRARNLRELIEQAEQ